MTLRRPIAPLTIAVLAIAVDEALAQSAFPAPLPGQGQIGTAGDPAFPPVNGSAPAATVGAPLANPFTSNGAVPLAGRFSAGPTIQAGVPSQDCMNEFWPLREDAEKRGKLIKAASDRHAGPDEACKLIKNFGEAETRMIGYAETHATKCGIPTQVSDQLKNGHKNTEAMRMKVCAIAQQMQQGFPVGPVGPIGDFPPYYGR